MHQTKPRKGDGLMYSGGWWDMYSNYSLAEYWILLNVLRKNMEVQYGGNKDTGADTIIGKP